MFVKPGPNPDLPGAKLKVRIPHSHMLLPDEGQEVPDHDHFWQRRLAHGDVVLVKSEPAASVKNGAAA